MLAFPARSVASEEAQGGEGAMTVNIVMSLVVLLAVIAASWAVVYGILWIGLQCQAFGTRSSASGGRPKIWPHLEQHQ